MGSDKLRELEESLTGELASNALVTFKIPPKWKAEIEAIAKRTNTSVSQVCRKMVEAYFTKSTKIRPEKDDED